MKRRTLIALSAVFVTAIAILLISSQTVLVSAQNHEHGKGDRDEPPPPFYNPYPFGILPADLNPEIARVLREVDFIENEALMQLRALPPPTLTNQPPLLAHTGQRLNVLVGKALNFDRNISPFNDRACAFCHMPYVGFSGPIPSVNLTMVAYPGSFQFRAGKRTAQRYTYAPSFPVLNFNDTQQAFFGGNFWDSRATGYLLGSPDANQAQGPPVDTQEHALPDTACIAFRLQSAVYKSFFIELWGDDLDAIKFPHNTEDICETPGGASIFGTDTMPIKLSPVDRAIANHVFDHWGQSIDQYEGSPDVSAFSSKFDVYLTYLAGTIKTNPFTPDEVAGYNLFRGKGNCNSCHLDGRSTAPTPPESQGCHLLSGQARFLRLYRESIWLRLPRFGIGNFPAKRSRLLGKPERRLDTICANFGRQNADVLGAQRGHDTATVPHHRSWHRATVLPEGVLPQRLHQEPEATRALLQHARCLSVQRHFRALPRRDNRKGRLLADA